jgi:hypothetical protein
MIALYSFITRKVLEYHELNIVRGKENVYGWRIP